MMAQPIDLLAAAAAMGLANWCSQPQSNSDPNSLVIQVQAQIRQGKRLEPGTRVRGTGSQETCSVELVSGVKQSVPPDPAGGLIPLPLE